MIIFSKLEKNLLELLSDEYPIDLTKLALSIKKPIDEIKQSLIRIQKMTDGIIETKKDHFQLSSPYFSIEKQNLQTPLNIIGFKDIFCFDCIDSTNQFLKDNKQLPTPVLCTSNMQTAGRGRQGRHWFSPFASNLYFSIKYPIPKSIADCAGLSLMIGLSLLEAIEKTLGHNNLLLKWPNDLIWQKKKLAGILIELSDNFIIIGVGINVNSLSHPNPLITKPWTSLREIYQKPIAREAILIECVTKIHENTQVFFEKGFEAFYEQWQNKDAFKNQMVSLTRGHEVIEGQAQGISKNGNLLILTNQGKLLELESGELS